MAGTHMNFYAEAHGCGMARTRTVKFGTPARHREKGLSVDFMVREQGESRHAVSVVCEALEGGKRLRVSVQGEGFSGELVVDRDRPGAAKGLWRDPRRTRKEA